MGIIGILEFDPDDAVVGKPENKDFMNMSPAERVPQSGKATCPLFNTRKEKS